jgi:chromosome partitioning protein
MTQSKRGLILAFLQLKGGVGKSTLAENIAVAFAHNNKTKVKIIDCDLRQRTSSKWVARRNQNHADKKKVFSSIQEEGLRDALVEDSKNYDVIIVDVQGKDSKNLRVSLLTADIIYIPFIPSQNDIETIEELSDLLEDTLIQNKNRRTFYILNSCSSHYLDSTSTNADIFFKEYQHILSPSQVRITHRKAYRDASLEGLGVIETNDKKAQKEICNLRSEIEQYV